MAEIEVLHSRKDIQTCCPPLTELELYHALSACPYLAPHNRSTALRTARSIGPTLVCPHRCAIFILMLDPIRSMSSSRAWYGVRIDGYHGI
eukprot:scaffold2470_cov158-Ochromonas_danica.AAC.6